MRKHPREYLTIEAPHSTFVGQVSLYPESLCPPHAPEYGKRVLQDRHILFQSCFLFPSCLSASSVELPFAFISPGGGELILIMLALILLFGAKDAPRIFRSIQTFLDKMQRSAADFRYKMMYGDIHANTTDEEPYEVEDGDQESENRDQETGADD